MTDHQCDAGWILNGGGEAIARCSHCDPNWKPPQEREPRKSGRRRLRSIIRNVDPRVEPRKPYRDLRRTNGNPRSVCRL